MNRIPVTEVLPPSPLDLISDGDFHTRETALLASYGRQGIDLGQTTRDRFTLADCSSMASRDALDDAAALWEHGEGESA